MPEKPIFTATLKFYQDDKHILDMIEKKLKEELRTTKSETIKAILHELAKK